MNEIITHVSELDDCIILYNMSIDEIIFYRQYFFKDDKTRLILSDVSVHVGFRKNKLGTRILKIHHDFCKLHGVKYSLLWVDKGSWMEQWYMRNGYVFHEEKSETENWLIKEIF